MKYYIVGVIMIMTLSLNAQVRPTVSQKTLSVSEKRMIDTHFKKYKTFSIDKKEILDSLKNYGRCNFRLTIDEDNDWTINLRLNDMRATNYAASFISDSGAFPFKSFVPNTYKGKTTDNKLARFTIDENDFWGLIIFSNEKQIMIRQTKDYTKNNNDSSLIMFETTDIIEPEKDYDNVSDIIVTPIENNNTNTPKSPLCTYYLEIATEADFEFYLAMGSSLANTYSHIFSVLNLIEGVYESTFNLKFIVTFQNVWTTSNDPYTSTTNAGTLLYEFRTEWNTNRTAINRDIAHIFTNRDFNDNTVGIAFTGEIGSSYAYSLSKYRNEMFKTTAHEIGHNLNADHPASPSDECLCGEENASVMCQGRKANNLWFCQTSINQISPFLASKSAILTKNIPNNLTLSGTATGFNEYQSREKIISTQVIENGATIYKTKEVELNGCFEVKAGAEFGIVVDDNGCD